MYFYYLPNERWVRCGCDHKWKNSSSHQASSHSETGRSLCNRPLIALRLTDNALKATLYAHNHGATRESCRALFSIIKAHIRRVHVQIQAVLVHVVRRLEGIAELPAARSEVSVLPCQQCYSSNGLAGNDSSFCVLSRNSARNE